ncbi:ABC transporter permease subunit [Paenibacillus doosanensis]|uniref:Multiple-sugar transport system permease YteP n=1 Tax=Paenibacillus konkukensis TaxID=2020716 RepID=A0ABY4RGT0_9BACL|nr:MULTISPECIES: ABC transporter permease subunit [Paenibacillus]MCS7463983.1 ABC transporter permease subunit [Paenibacillus doosanensis]UQZ81423.1 putative multiple-sugar transport system permease YteP [Paenibacillus konkukensis]
MSSPIGDIAEQSRTVSSAQAGRWKAAWKYIKRDKYLYLLLVPVLAYYLIFKYAPMFGEIIAFKNYRFADGIWGSQWAGLKHFQRLFTSPDFFNVLKNTLLLNVYSIVFAFPVPILLAILLNEVRVEWYKRMIQNLLYIPHFISWVVLGGIVIALLSPSTGIVNTVLKLLGLEPVYFMASNFWWPIMFIVSGIWQSAGWGTILYLAAMAGIDPQLYEAAKIDGASKLRRIWHVTIPGIRSTIAILLILRVGQMMDVGFEQVFILQNKAVYEVSNVISTYVYHVGLEGAQYSYTTALGLFQSVIGLILVVGVNKLIKAMGENGLW